VNEDDDNDDESFMDSNKFYSATAEAILFVNNIFSKRHVSIDVF
jgi:hypothetical protein